MNADDAGREDRRLLSWVVGMAISMSVIAAYVALGATVLVGRTLMGAVSGTWRRLSSLGVHQRDDEARTPRAA